MPEQNQFWSNRRSKPALMEAISPPEAEMRKALLRKIQGPKPKHRKRRFGFKGATWQPKEKAKGQTGLAIPITLFTKHGHACLPDAPTQSTGSHISTEERE